MNIVNGCAVKSGGIVYPWKILPISVPGVSITDFFFSKVEPEFPSFDAYDLQEAYLGSSRENLDCVAMSLPLNDCVILFGHYLKYVVNIKQTSVHATPVNAFEVLMEAAKKQSSSSFLPDRRNETNSKDRLDYLDEHNLKWTASEASTFGKSFLKALTDLLWYTNGQHDRFNHQSCLIPKVFRDLTVHSYMVNSGKLLLYSQAVYRCLLSDYWRQKNWKSFKTDINLLLNAITKYVDGLEQHNKRMNTSLHHL